VIKAGEGVMIYSTGRNAHLNYNHNSKTRSHNKSNYINVIASGNNGSDNIIINFDENEEKAFPKLKNFNDEIANVYLKVLDIQCAIGNYNYNVDEIPLYFDAKKMGNYTLSFDLQGEFDNIYMIDRKTGREININTEKQYTFMSGQDDRHDRFIIRMGEKQEDDFLNENFVYIENGTIQLVTFGNMKGVEEFQTNVDIAFN
jgi:RecB family endonuclease NucS